MTQVFSTLVDTYTAVRELAQSETACIMAAQGGGDTIAIKLLNVGRPGSLFYRRFKAERSFAECISHPNVIRVLDAGTRGPLARPFYVMPLYPWTLRQAIERGLPAARVPEIFGKMLDGIEAAHLQGVWHRDLKPGNILLSEDLSQVVVCDFGSAHFSGRGENTAPWEILCSYRYAAPEQEQGQPCTPATDVFALGLMLNEIFTQRIPHGTGYRLIGSIAPRWAHLDALVERMIRQEPRDRPQSIAAVRESTR